MSSFKTALALAAIAAAPPALACSTCKCGDYTLTLMGNEKPYAQRLRLAADVLTRSESAGAQETDEQRLNLGVSYALTPDWTLALRLPYVHKEVRGSNLSRIEAQGWGDADLLARRVLYQSMEPVTRSLAGLSLGLRLPTAERIRDAAGNEVDIDAQPDAGALAPQIGLWASRFAWPWFFSGAVSYFHYGEGRQGFDPGNAATASLLGQYALEQDWALQGGVDLRQAGRNRFSGVTDPDSGGGLAMASLGATWRPRGDFLLHAGVQLPLADQLNGEQDEDAALRLGFAFDLE